MAITILVEMSAGEMFIGGTTISKALTGSMVGMSRT